MKPHAWDMHLWVEGCKPSSPWLHSVCNTLQVRPGAGRKRPRNRGGYAEKMKQNLHRLQEERDADHSALRTAVQLSGHLVLGGAAAHTSSASSHGKGVSETDDVKGKGKGKGRKGKKGKK